MAPYFRANGCPDCNSYVPLLHRQHILQQSVATEKYKELSRSKFKKKLNNLYIINYCNFLYAEFAIWIPVVDRQVFLCIAVVVYPEISRYEIMVCFVPNPPRNLTTIKNIHSFDYHILYCVTINEKSVVVTNYVVIDLKQHSNTMEHRLFIFNQIIRYMNVYLRFILAYMHLM